MTSEAISKASATLSKEDLEKTLPKIKRPAERKSDDGNAPLNTAAIDIPQVAATDPGNLGFGVKANGSNKVDVEA